MSRGLGDVYKRQGHSITGATSEITCGSSALALSVDAAMYLIVVWPQIGPISEQQSSLS